MRLRDEFLGQSVERSKKSTQKVRGGKDAQGEPDGDQAQVDDGEVEARAPRAARDPGQPTRAERDEHDLTHIPYRPWITAI